MEDLSQIRKALFRAAYHMLGEVQDSDDVVQEVLLDLSQKVESGSINSIESPTAYGVKAAVNKSINVLKRKNKQAYHGEWLPEPLLHPQDAQDSRIDISYGFTHLLTKLNPKERAVFILRESFDISFKEIAEELGITEEHSRKLCQRSRQKLKGTKSVTSFEPEKKELLVQNFIHAVSSGDLQSLISMLLDDIKIFSDGGGKVPAAIHPIAGATACSRFLLNIWENTRKDLIPRLGQTAHGPAILFYERLTMNLATVVVPQFSEDKLQVIYIQRNPDKLMRHKVLT